MINIVIPMAGLGSRFASAGYEKPKPFIDVNGIPMVIKVIENLNCPNARFILIARKEHLENEKQIVDEITNKYNAIFIPIENLTEGTLCTILFARNLINDNNPLLIANSDQLVDIDISEFINNCFNRKLDGSILCFEDDELNPKWSFAKLDDNNLVELEKEKEAISKFATVGIYFFNQGSSFVDSSIEMIIKNDRVNNEFYTCPVYNYLISKGAKIGIYKIDYSQMHGLGTPEDLTKYLSNS